MIDRILINNNNFEFMSSNEESIFFSLDDYNKIKIVKNILIDSSEIVVKFDISMENVENFFVIYNKLFGDEMCTPCIILDIIDYDDEDIKKNKEILKFLEAKTHCVFSYRYNTYATANIEEILNAIDFVEEQAKIVKYYNFSPIESLIFIFDMVRDREYVKESREEGLDVSRNLSKIISSSKIVCGGYASLFSAIANKVGIYTEVVSWISENEFGNGHASNICYVNDSVYDIHGILEVDTTLGRKRTEDNSFLKDYSAFGKSLSYASDRNLRFKLKIDNYDNLFGKILSQYRLVSDENIKMIESMYKLFVINLVAKVKRYKEIIGQDIGDCLEIEKLLNNFNFEKISMKIEELLLNLEYSFYDFIINYDDFIKMLYKVRRVEYSIDRDKYLFSIEELYDVLIKTYGNDMFFKIFIFNESRVIDLISSKLCDFNESYRSLDVKKELINLDIKQMELVSILKKIRKK